MFGIVINKQGYKVEFVSLNEDKTPQFYTLKNGESIVEDGWEVANSMNKPQRVNGEWIDTELLPPVDPPVEAPNQMEILQSKVTDLETENATLKYRLESTENAILDLMLTGYNA